MPKSQQTRWTPPVKPITRKCPECGAGYLFILHQRRRCPSCHVGIVAQGEALHVKDCPLTAEMRDGRWVRVD